MSAQSNHPCPRNGRADANRFPTGLDQMSMMKEPINRRRSHGLGHQLVESRRMEIRRNRDGSLLISSIDKPIQTFGSIITDRQQPDVVNDHEIGSQQPLNSLRYLVRSEEHTSELQ